MENGKSTLVCVSFVYLYMRVPIVYRYTKDGKSIFKGTVSRKTEQRDGTVSYEYVGQKNRIRIVTDIRNRITLF